MTNLVHILKNNLGVYAKDLSRTPEPVGDLAIKQEQAALRQQQSTPTASANKTMTTRKNIHGKSSVSQKGMDGLQGIKRKKK